MDNIKKLGDMLAGLNKPALPLFNAEVKSIEGESCTIIINNIEIDDVRLKATINGKTNKILTIPAVGSMVLVGSLTGDLKDLAVLAVDEIAKLQYEQDGLQLLIDSTDGKVSIGNAGTDLFTLFQMLTDLLKAFKVFTPSGPSGGPLPPTIVSITNFETAFKTLLK